jgi:hypothetical protein
MSQSQSFSAKCPRSAHQSEADAQDNSSNRMNTVHEKVSHIAHLLHGWSWRFSDFIRYWIAHNNGTRGKRGYQKRVDIIRYLLDDDPDATLKAMKDNSVRSYSMNMATAFLVHEIRMELEELRPSDVGQRTRM